MIMVLTFAATLVVGVPASAQDDATTSTEAFQVTVTEARDAAQAKIDEGDKVAQDGCEGLAFEACQKQFLTVQFALAAQENAAFADLLEGLDAPDAYADDVAAQVAALRDISAFLQEAATAAEAADPPRMINGLNAMNDTLVALSARLRPEYARFALLSDNAAVLVSDFGGSTLEEIAYIQGIGNAGLAAASNFGCFNRALDTSYGGTDALLGALYDCGAGTALAAIEEAGKQLTPPESFADEHAWWLAAAAELTRLDGLIGEAAREGDVLKFLANNVRTGLAQRPYPGMDTRFLATIFFVPAIERVDRDNELGRSDYGQALFAALLDYAAVNPGELADDLDFPQVPRDVALGAVAQLAPELLALEADLREALEALVPPDEFAADQALMLDFANGQRDRLERFIAAAATGDTEAADALHDAEQAQFCAVANQLSEPIQTITVVFFDPESGDCR